MMRLVTGYLQIGLDLLALTGKKSYEFSKVEKSQKMAIFVVFLLIKSLEYNENLRKPVYMMCLVAGYLNIGLDLLALTGKKSY